MASPNGFARTSRMFNRWYGRLFSANPYPLYRFLRRRFPVVRTPIGFWITTRYAECFAILRDRRTSTFDVSALDSLPQNDGLKSMQRLLQQAMQFRFPPDHTRLRKVIGSFFSAATLASLRPRIQKIADRLLDAVQDRGRMDVIADLAFPLPVEVLSEVMGVPQQDRRLLHGWVRTLGVSIDPAMSAHDPGASVRETLETAKQYFTDLAAEKRRHPRAELMSQMVEATSRGEIHGDEELAYNALFTLVAGHETTMNMIGNGTISLLRHSDALVRLRRESSLIPSAVGEFLRYESPAQVTFRTAIEDIEVAGRTIPAGEHVIVVLGAANRDPARFPDPDRLDVARTNNHHLAFAGGIHRCVGEPLALIEGEITFETLLRRMPRLALGRQKPRWRQVMVLRGLDSLPVEF
jgi:pimeloyl-[acyl-carrier protein] synthase